MELLNKLDDVKSLHLESWNDVESSIGESIEDFDFYFDYVNREAKKLYSLWKENIP